MKLFQKSILFILILVFIFGLGFAIFEKSQTQIRNYIAATVTKPCRTPIKYAIGEIDPQFNITRDQLMRASNQAADAWNKASGLDLFQYDPAATLQIKMVYDERQQATNEAEQIKNSLNNLDLQKASLDNQQSALSGEYDKKLAILKKEVDKYENNLKQYAEEVSDWNSQGRTSEEEYNKLKKEEQDLKGQFDKLKKEEAELNAIAKKANIVITQENNIISSYNSAVNTYKSKFGNSQEFEKGVFDPSAGIIIYQFKEISDLELTLVHEFGHALGIGHVENPKAIMYYMIGEQNLDNPALTADDLAALREVCQL